MAEKSDVVSISSVKVAVVCVTFNRLGMLKPLLLDYSKQQNVINTIVVVNNSSVDGTAEYLDEWLAIPGSTKKIVKHLPENVGGSGGFYEAFRIISSLDEEFDFIYVADDDAYPGENLFSDFVAAADDYESDILAVCAVVRSNGLIDFSHRRRVGIRAGCLIETNVPLEEYSKLQFELDEFSYVGVFLRGSVLKCGIYPQKDFFIFCDDTEHSLQVRKLGRIVCDTRLFVRHDALAVAGSVNWKRFYGLRNRLLMIRYRFGYYVFLVEIVAAIWSVAIRCSRGLKFRVVRMEFAAIWQAAINRKGLHEVYRPGWMQ